jgi:D-galacturonate reductase
MWESQRARLEATYLADIDSGLQQARTALDAAKAPPDANRAEQSVRAATDHLGRMRALHRPIDVTVLGGGMFVNDVVLPSLYHLQRTGTVGKISIIALEQRMLDALRENRELVEAFPGLGFDSICPPLNVSDQERYAYYKKVLAAMPARQLVAVVLPDPLHYEAIMHALECNQHVLSVKPLVLTSAESEEIAATASSKGLFVGIEYHKRLDTRSLMARRHYQLGHFGQFVMGEAKMIEPRLYRNSNFQNWFTCERTDPFTYVSCHYFDLVWFITGLRAVEVSLAGIKGRFPNGKVGYMWSNGRIVYENDAMLTVTSGLGYPDDGSGSNEQCLEMFFEGKDKTGLLKHDDQYRGVIHSYLEGIGPGGTHHNFVSPDFFQLVPWEGPGFRPEGYGYKSVSSIVQTAHFMEAASSGLPEDQGRAARQARLKKIDELGLLATPSNSVENELIIEAGRKSISDGGRAVRIRGR